MRLFHCHERVSVFKGRSAWPRRQWSRAERFIIAPIQIDLPSLQRAPGIDDLPSSAPKDFVHRVVQGRQLRAVRETVFTFSGRGRGPRDEDVGSATDRVGGEAISAPPVVTDILESIDRRRDPTEPFFFHSSEELARIFI